MPKRVAVMVILAEDKRSATLCRRFLRNWLQTSQREFREIVAPSGRGSGEQFVRNEYANQVHDQRLRVRGSGRNAALLVHIDADVSEVTQRHDQLAQALNNAGRVPRQDNELIAIVVPKRNTETWLRGLTGTAVDEKTNYRDPSRRSTRDDDSLIVPAADALYNATRPNAPNPCPQLPALKRAMNELRRLERQIDR